MRESRTFGVRSKIKTSDVPIKKFFLVFEGLKTEKKYFEAVYNARQTLDISPSIELIHLERCKGEEGWSNPKKILNSLTNTLAEQKGSVLTYSTLLTAIQDCLYTNKYYQKRSHLVDEIWKFLKSECETKLKRSLSDVVKNKDKAIQEILMLIEESKTNIHKIILQNITSAIEAMQITYAEEIDRLCFIFDRDRKSFSIEQYNDVLKICKEKKISVYPSNPCFEFWLLLHFDNVFDFDKEKLLANEKISKSKKANNYTVHCLKKTMKHYTKANYDTDILMKQIPTAIKNEKEFSEDLEELENQLGSRVGFLMKEILSK